MAASKLKLVMFLGSTREGRLGDRVAKFVRNTLEQKNKYEITLFGEKTFLSDRKYLYSKLLVADYYIFYFHATCSYIIIIHCNCFILKLAIQKKHRTYYRVFIIYQINFRSCGIRISDVKETPPLLQRSKWGAKISSWGRIMSVIFIVHLIIFILFVTCYQWSVRIYQE